MKQSLLVLACLAVFSVSGKSKETQFIPAGNKAFHYMGRTMLVQENEAKFNWPGVSVSTEFTGNQLGIRLKSGSQNYFNVWIDNQSAGVLHAVNDSVWWYPEKLSGGKHQLRIVKRTEGGMGMASFYGIFIQKKGSVQTLQQQSDRKLLFVGNSITCGYGTEGKSKAERFKPSTENCEKSYATILARALNAQYQLISHSGLGMIRNYGDPEKISRKRKPMPARLEYTFDEDSTKHWDMNTFQPQGIVVNLGTNDFSTQPFPDETDFLQATDQLLTRLSEFYPQAKIFCITGPMINEPCYSYMKKAVEQFSQKNKETYITFIGVPKGLLNDNSDLGSDYHPSYRGQIKTATLILPVMANMLDWNYSTTEIEKVLSDK